MSQYRDANPVPTKPLADDIVTAPSGPVCGVVEGGGCFISDGTLSTAPSLFDQLHTVHAESERHVSLLCIPNDKGERELFYLTTHSTHFIYGYMASDIWLRTILIVIKETRCRHIG